MTAIPQNQAMIDQFHAKQGRGVGPFGDNLVLLTSQGAKSGRRITTPLVAGRDGDDVVVVASKGGAPEHPRWYGNVIANPEVEVELPEGAGTRTFRARARALPSGPERDRLYELMARVWPAFRNYETKTERTIPVVVLEEIS